MYKEVSHDAHPEFMYNIHIIKPLSIAEDV